PVLRSFPTRRSSDLLAGVLMAPVLAARAAEDAPDAKPQAAAARESAAPNTLSEQEKKAGFKLLFDGKSTDGWRSYKGDKISPKRSEEHTSELQSQSN